jgi:hypothetical protein
MVACTNVGLSPEMQKKISPENTTEYTTAGLIFMKILMIPFFMIHYGGFLFGHALFLFVLFHGDNTSSILLLPNTYFYLTIIALFASHAYSFVVNYIFKHEYEKYNLGQLMALPYHRVIILHIAIIIGGVVSLVIGSPIVFLFNFIALKMLVDLYFHEKEHQVLIQHVA